MEEGRRAVLTCMLRMAAHQWTEFLHTPAKIIAAIRRLEELQCLNMAQVITMWAWTVGVVNPVDRVAWKLIQDETLRFYRTHGVQRPVALARHIIDKSMDHSHEWFLRVHYKNSPYRVKCARRPDRTIGEPCSNMNEADLYPSQACQLRRLYHLIGYNPTTWGEAVAVEEVDEEMGMSEGYSAAPRPFTDSAWNHP